MASQLRCQCIAIFTRCKLINSSKPMRQNVHQCTNELPHTRAIKQLWVLLTTPLSLGLNIFKAHQNAHSQQWLNWVTWIIRWVMSWRNRHCGFMVICGHQKVITYSISFPRLFLYIFIFVCFCEMDKRVTVSRSKFQPEHKITSRYPSLTTPPRNGLPGLFGEFTFHENW